MAFSNTYDTANTGSAVSNREHLTDVLTILAPEETPILALAQKEKARATFVEWTVDSLSSPVTSGVGEGDDVSSYADKHAERARIGNYVQKWRRPWKVSDLQEAVDSVGPAGVASAEGKSLREVKRDMEATFCSTNDRAAEDGAGQAYNTRGLGDWIDSSGPSDVPAAYRTPSASIHTTGVISETVMNDILTSIYRQVGARDKERKQFVEILLGRYHTVAHDVHSFL